MAVGSFLMYPSVSLRLSCPTMCMILTSPSSPFARYALVMNSLLSEWHVPATLALCMISLTTLPRYSFEYPTSCVRLLLMCVSRCPVRVCVCLAT